MPAIRIVRAEVHRLRVAVAAGPLSSLGPMPVRNGLLVRLEDADGAHGWGEVWCNFPPRGADARAALLADVILPALIETPLAGPQDALPTLTRHFARMAIHTGEAGPFAHCIAGLDVALWDLDARRAGLPLHRHLGAAPASRVPVYASTPDPTRLEDAVADLRAEGHREVKLKIGFDPERDRRTVSRVRAVAGPDVRIMVDANQAWTVGEARDRIAALAAYDLAFVEEPLRADEPVEAWRTLAAGVTVPLAAGENILGSERWAAHIAAAAPAVLQPDVAKWGGLTGGLDVGRRARTAGLRVCPHFMGTAVGLAASAHLLAAVGGDGRVELDANANPLRTDLGPIDLTVRSATIALPDGPGLGFEPDPDALRRFAAP
jgi:L-alanine-DL-glutamate epimerase-like enolase superfamily enzyme